MSMLQTEPLSLTWQPAPTVAMFSGGPGSTHSTQCPNCTYKFPCPQQPQRSPNSGGGMVVQQPFCPRPSGPLIPTPIGVHQIVTTQSSPFIGGGQHGLIRTQCHQLVGGSCLHNQSLPIVPISVQNQVVCCQSNQVVFSAPSLRFSEPAPLLVNKSPSFAERPKRTTVRSQLSGGRMSVVTPEEGRSPGPSPESTPVAQITFEMPTFSMDGERNQCLLGAIEQPILVPVKGPSQPVPEKELQSLTNNLKALKQSGWYYEGISYQESHELLRHTKVGTFLIRNSSDPQFLFTLSVQTDRGPTSVRLHYINGFFKLDSQRHLQTVMRAFPSVIELIEYYVYLFKFRFFRGSKEHVWVDGCGKWYSSIKLLEPLRKREEPPSLKHLARMAIHKAIQSSGKPRIPEMPVPFKHLELPTSLVQYLSEYPHSI